MPISDAQYAIWLKDSNARRVVLVELDFAYQVPVNSATGTVATNTLTIGDYPFVTEPGDTPSNRLYRDAVVSVGEFERSIDHVTLGGRTSFTVGEIRVANPDGDFDFMAGLIIDGRECRCLLGDETWPISDFRAVLTVLARTIDNPSQTEAVINLQDNGLLLNSSLIGGPLGGSGPNADKPYPIICGFCNNVELPLIDSANLVYGVHDGSGAEAIEVYDSGLSLAVESPYLADLGSTFTVDVSADTITHPSINLAIDDILRFTTVASMGIVSGDAYFVKTSDPVLHSISLSTTRGGGTVNLTGQFSPGETVVIDRYPALDNLDTPRTVTLAHAPAGRITCDVDVPLEASTPQIETRFSDLIYHLAVTRAGLSPAAFDGALPSFNDGDNACDFHLGLAVMDRQNVGDLIDQAADSVNGFWGFDYRNKLVYGRIIPYELDSLPEEFTITSDDVLDIQSVTMTQIPPSYNQIRGYFYKQWADQQDSFLAGVPLDRVSMLQAGGLFASSPDFDSTRYEDNPCHFHESTVVAPDVVTLISQQSCANAYAEMQDWLLNRRARLFPILELLTVRVNFAYYNLQLGACGTVTLDRFGLDSGERFQIVTHRPLLIDSGGKNNFSVLLTLIRRRIANFDTSDYP